MVEGTPLAHDNTAQEGFATVLAGVALTVVLWVFVPFMFSIAVAFSPPFLLAIIVAFAARRMRWGIRTAIASTAVLACVSVLQAAFYLRDSGHIESIGFIVIVESLGILATWLAWKGGLILAERR